MRTSLVLSALIVAISACLAQTLPVQPAPPPPKDLLTYAGAPAATRFTCALPLSDGTVLVGGAADSLTWLPRDVQRIQFDAFGIANDAGAGKNGDTTAPHIGFLMQLSPDLTSILRVAAFPPGGVEDIRWIKADNMPGERTAGLFISGTTRDTSAKGGGYFIGKLNNNFVNGAPTGLAWVRNIYATGEYQTRQPWDVGSDGKVVYATGAVYDPSGGAVQRLKADGTDDIVPSWRTHWTLDGKIFYGTIRRRDMDQYTRSAVMMTPVNNAELRSWDTNQCAEISGDGNGGQKTGRWPLDDCFSGPGDPANPAKVPASPGVGGWSLVPGLSYRVGGIAVDRRSNDIFLGASAQVVTPTAKKTMPFVIAFSDSGDLMWWSRLQPETTVGNEASETVDDLAMDYSTFTTKLVVLGRSSGASAVMFWKGSEVNLTKAPGKFVHGFQDGYTGPAGADIGWLGKLSAEDGTLQCATCIGELADDPGAIGPPSANALLDGWPNPNTAWPTLATTSVHSGVTIDAQGRVYLTASGQRTLTTANAFQKMSKPGAGASTPNDFVRVYAPGLDTLVYSSVLTGTWDAKTGDGGGNVALLGVCPLNDAVLVIGYQKASADGKTAAGKPVTTALVPPWGAAAPGAETAVLGRLSILMPKP